jgi:hypothetical protein
MKLVTEDGYRARLDLRGVGVTAMVEVLISSNGGFALYRMGSRKSPGASLLVGPTGEAVRPEHGVLRSINLDPVRRARWSGEAGSTTEELERR